MGWFPKLEGCIDKDPGEGAACLPDGLGIGPQRDGWVEESP